VRAGKIFDAGPATKIFFIAIARDGDDPIEPNRTVFCVGTE
jgi:hypothetical protein